MDDVKNTSEETEETDIPVNARRVGDTTQHVRVYQNTNDDAPVINTTSVNERQIKGATMRVYVDENVDTDRKVTKRVDESKIMEDNDMGSVSVKGSDSMNDNYEKSNKNTTTGENTKNKSIRNIEDLTINPRDTSISDSDLSIGSDQSEEDPNDDFSDTKNENGELANESESSSGSVIENEEEQEEESKNITTRGGRVTRRINYSDLSKYGTQMHQEGNIIGKHNVNENMFEKIMNIVMLNVREEQEFEQMNVSAGI